jgi:hypothetical protein
VIELGVADLLIKQFDQASQLVLPLLLTRWQVAVPATPFLNYSRRMLNISFQRPLCQI